MEREERRRKFHESLKQILFPPPSTSPPSPPTQGLNIHELASSNTRCLIPDELGEFKTSSSSEDERECGTQKPTRAYRKRVRKKKMKEYAERRNGLIGPLRDAPDEDKGVRRNASEKLCIENDRAGMLHRKERLSGVGCYNYQCEVAPCANQSKVKNRRRAKRLAKEKSSIAEKSQQDCDSTET